MFSDTMTIISKNVELTKSQARKILNPLVELRNNRVIHRPLITSKEEKVKLKERNTEPYSSKPGIWYSKINKIH